MRLTNFIPGVGPVLLGTNQLLSINPNGLGPAASAHLGCAFKLGQSGVHIRQEQLRARRRTWRIRHDFAKRIFGNDDTVIRAGFRVGYDDIFNNIPANMGLNAPYNLGTTQTAGVTQPGKFPGRRVQPGVPLVKLNPNGTPQVGLVGFSAEDQNIRSAYVYQYNTGIQRKLGQSLVDRDGLPGQRRPQAGPVRRLKPAPRHRE